MIPIPHRTLRIPYRFRGASKTLAVHEWGEPTNSKTLVCVHGLSRNGRDFDVFADAMCDQYRVLCPDVPGRGESEWLDRAEDYVVPSYVQILSSALGALNVRAYDWVGTSMGGLIGLGLGVTPGNGLQRFVINDVGPTIETEALNRIGLYMRSKAPTFDAFEQLFAAAQIALAPFGPLTDGQKLHLIRTSSTCGADLKWRFNSDPKISDAFVAALAAPSVDLWPFWTALRQPTLILRGEHSDLLSANTVEKMLKTRPSSQLHTVADTGHAPMLMDAPTIARVRQFLLTA